MQLRLVLLLGTLNILLASQPVFSQAPAPSPENLLPPRFIPKSPTTSTLPRFDTQQLVNLPTGGAQLAVPMAEVTRGSLHLSVALAYSYTGLKVAQPYDLVGLGWTLQAGGSITRQVNGLVDDLYVNSPDQRYDEVAILTNVNDQKYLKKGFDNLVDTGPDVYNFSLPGGPSGRFVLRDTTVVLFPQQPVHIRPLGGHSTLGFRGFQITTEDGVRYQFLDAEVTTPNPNNYGHVGTHYSGWQLTRLLSADNSDTISLHYSTYGSEELPRQCSLTTGRYYTGTYQELGNVIDQNGRGFACGSEASYSFHNVKSFVSHVKAQYLNSITTRGTALALTRDEVSHEVRQLLLLATTGGQREIKRIMLFQSRFAGGEPTDYRLRLDSLRESANGTALPAYRFTYFGDTAPIRGSAAQDYWGYANGATQNGDYNTEETQTNPTLLADPHLHVAGVTPANREPDFEAALTGALRAVRYPTGGTAQWEYEPGRLRVAAGDIPLSYRNLDVGTGYNPDKAKTIPDGPRLPVTSSGVLTFQVTEEADVNVGLYRQPSGDGATGGTNTYQDFSIWQVLPTGKKFVTDPPDAPAYRIIDSQPPNREYVFHLLPGTYAAQVYCEIHEADSGIGLRIPYHDSTQVKLGLLGPGIRVLRTTTTAAGAPPLVRTYQYSFAGYSSGMSLLPELGKGFDHYESDTEYSNNNKTALIETRCTYQNVTSDNRGLGNEFNKYDSYYTCVTELNGTSQGRSVSYFTHQPYQFNDVVLAKQQLYRQGSIPSQAPQLVQQTRYSYLTDSLANYPFLRVHDLLSYVIKGGDNGVPNNTYDPQLYYVWAAFMAPSLTILTHYDEQGLASTTLTRSIYQRQRLVSTATRHSTGWEIQRFKRLSDYAPLAAVAALRVNSFNPVLETQTWHRPLDSPDSVLTAGRITLYDPTWRSPARLYQLRLAQPLAGPNQETKTNGRYASLLSDTRYEPLASVRYAAGTGDLIQQQATHGLPTSFLMGYERTLVIAEAKNAAYNQLAYSSFEPTATGRWRYDSTGTHRVGTASRTGRWAYRLDGRGSVISRDQLPVGDYELTTWVQGSTPPALALVGGQVVSGWQPVATASGQWQQYHTSLRFTAKGQVSLDSPVGSSALLLDELRLSPVGAQLTTYTHDPLIGMTSQTDPTGRTLTYEYDDLGRLIRTRDEQGRILSQQQYHYAGK